MKHIPQVVAGFFTLIGSVASTHLNFKSSLRSGKKEDTQSTLLEYTEAAVEDHITTLPGLHYEPSFRQFSGYLTVSEATNRSIFYWYVESQNDPSTDPVVFWTNGGPGCSGLLAFGTEHGPFYYSANGTLSENPYSWNNVANMLYVEQPAGVGFSYSDDPDDYTTGDAQAASDNYVLIQQFLERFPERKSNDFYITSESYGGHYIPELTAEILKHNQDGAINFKGFAVGNPYVDPFTNDNTMYDAFYSHGLLTDLLYGPWKDRCTKKKGFHLGCAVLESAMTYEMEPGINPYALDYPVCLDKNGDLKMDPKRMQHHQLMKHTGKFDLMQEAMKQVEEENMEDMTVSSTSEKRRLEKYAEYKPCEEDYFTKYLNREDVREAIGVHKDAGEWEVCSSKINYSQDDSNKSLIKFYKKVVTAGLEMNLHMMVYSGDDDSICSLSGTQDWIYDLGIEPKRGKVWKHWFDSKGQVAGYKTLFENKVTKKGDQGFFVFVTVHGAGHEVPAYKPAQSLEMFSAYLKGKW